MCAYKTVNFASMHGVAQHSAVIALIPLVSLSK